MLSSLSSAIPIASRLSMFPMISSLQEFLEAKETLLLEYEREKQRQKPTAKKVNIGIMIEVPSVLFQLDELLQQVDFVSVGALTHSVKGLDMSFKAC